MPTRHKPSVVNRQVRVGTGATSAPAEDRILTVELPLEDVEFAP
jgi:hypothetical protein